MTKNFKREMGYGCDFYDSKGCHINTYIDYFCKKVLKTPEENNTFFYKYFLKYTDYGLLRYLLDGPDKREVLAKALKEVAKTPTGRMALWKTMKAENIRINMDDGKSNKDVEKKELYMRKPRGAGDVLGYVPSSQSNEIHVLSENIKEQIQIWSDSFLKGLLPPSELTEQKKEQAILFSIGSTFLHEIQHSRQGEAGITALDVNPIYRDAAPQALSRQLVVESDSPILHKINSVSNREIDAYKKAVDYNPKTGEVNLKKAMLYSQKMQQRYAIDFAQILTKQPFLNYSPLSYLWNGYIADSIDFADRESSKKDKEVMTDYFKKANRIFVDMDNFLPPKLKEIFSYLHKRVKENCSEEEYKYVSMCFKERKLPDPDEFRFGEKGVAYQWSLVCCNENMYLSNALKTLSILSQKIHDGKAVKEEIKEVKRIRETLKKKYGIEFYEKNRDGQKITHLISEPQTQKKEGEPSVMKTLAAFKMKDEEDVSFVQIKNNGKTC